MSCLAFYHHCLLTCGSRRESKSVCGRVFGVVLVLYDKDSAVCGAGLCLFGRRVLW